MFLPSGSTLNDFFVALHAVISTELQAAKKKSGVTLPGKKTPPRGINPTAQKKYWDEFVDKYSDVWGKYKNDPEKQWAACVAIWINYCLKRKVQPFNASETEVNEETKDKLLDRMLSARNSQLRLANSLLSRGTRMGVVSKFLKETLLSVEEKKPGEFTVITQRVVTPEKGVKFDSPKFRELMSKMSFERKAGKYVRSVKTNTSVILVNDEDKGRPLMWFKNVFTRPYLETVLSIPNKKGNSEELKTGITRLWKKVIKEFPEVLANE